MATNGDRNLAIDTGRGEHRRMVREGTKGRE